MKLNQLGKRLRKLGSEFEEETKRLMVESTETLASILPDFTPVDTGNAYSNWLFSAVFPDRIEQFNKQKEKAINLKAPDHNFQQFVSEYMSIPISNIYINNNAHYILDIYTYGIILSELNSVAQDIARYKYKCLK